MPGPDGAPAAGAGRGGCHSARSDGTAAATASGAEHADDGVRSVLADHIRRVDPCCPQRHDRGSSLHEDTRTCLNARLFQSLLPCSKHPLRTFFFRTVLVMEEYHNPRRHFTHETAPQGCCNPDSEMKPRSTTAKIS